MDAKTLTAIIFHLMVERKSDYYANIFQFKKSLFFN